MLIDEKISSGHARALIAIEDNEKQYKAACKIFNEKISVRGTGKLVKEINSAKPKKSLQYQKTSLIYI